MHNPCTHARPFVHGLLASHSRSRQSPRWQKRGVQSLSAVQRPDVQVHLLGRVASVTAIFIGSSNELGAFESGTAARLIGTVPSVVLGGIATLLVVGIIALKVPPLRRLREIQPAG